MKIKCVVACRGADGIPTFFPYIADVTQEEYDTGVHYDQAKSAADTAGYDGSMLTYDENDGPGWLFTHLFSEACAPIPLKPISNGTVLVSVPQGVAIQSGKGVEVTQERCAVTGEPTGVRNIKLQDDPIPQTYTGNFDIGDAFWCDLAALGFIAEHDVYVSVSDRTGKAVTLDAVDDGASYVADIDDVRAVLTNMAGKAKSASKEVSLLIYNDAVTNVRLIWLDGDYSHLNNVGIANYGDNSYAELLELLYGVRDPNIPDRNNLFQLDDDVLRPELLPNKIYEAVSSGVYVHVVNCAVAE